MRVLFFSCLVATLSASPILADCGIVDDLFNTSPLLMMRPDDPDDPVGYIGTLFTEQNKLQLIYESMGLTPSIMGFDVIDGKLHLLIKSRWTGAEEPREDEHFDVVYFQTIISSNGGAISCSSKRLENIDLHGFVLMPAMVNDNRVNSRTGPSFNSTVVLQKNRGDQLEIISLGDEYETIGDMSDYWFEFKDNSQSLWIYGYFIDFVNAIEYETLYSDNELYKAGEWDGAGGAPAPAPPFGTTANGILPG